MDYDPVAKTYIGRPAPLKTGRVYSAGDLAECGVDVSKIFGNEEDICDSEEFEEKDD